MFICFGLPQASSHAVIHSNADPADFTNSAATIAAVTVAAIAVTISRLVPDSVDVLPSLALLTGVVLYSFNLSSAHLLLIYIFYSPNLFFLNKTILAFLTFLMTFLISCSFLHLAVL